MVPPTSNSDAERRRSYMQWRFYTSAEGGEVAKSELRGLDEHASGARAAMVELMQRYQRDQSTVLKREFENYGDGLHALKVTIEQSEFRCYFIKEGRFSHVLVAIAFRHKTTQKIPKHVRRLIRQRRSSWQQSHRTG